MADIWPSSPPLLLLLLPSAVAVTHCSDPSADNPKGLSTFLSKADGGLVLPGGRPSPRICLPFKEVHANPTSFPSFPFQKILQLGPSSYVKTLIH